MNEIKCRNFASDSKTEKKVAQFLDDNFYSCISACMDNFERVTDKNRQVQGMDLIFNDKVIDEKVKNCGNPNRINEWYCSVEIYQHYTNGDWKKGWFVADNQKTTHYHFIYYYEDVQGNVEKAVIVQFNKQNLMAFLDGCIAGGMDEIVKKASEMEYARKYYDDVKFYDLANRRVGKLTMSKENAAVFAFNLTDLRQVKDTKIFEIKKNCRPTRIQFNELKKMFN